MTAHILELIALDFKAFQEADFMLAKHSGLNRPITQKSMVMKVIDCQAIYINKNEKEEKPA